MRSNAIDFNLRVIIMALLSFIFELIFIWIPPGINGLMEFDGKF